MSSYSRAAAKLEHGLDRFGVEVRDRRCADFGCNVGGFTGELLRRGASSVHAIDTAYGILAWELRQDPRVLVMERTNALHALPPEGGVDLVVVDLGWTPQRLAVPAALRWLRDDGIVVSLIKPHYEASAGGARPQRGGLPAEEAEAVLDRVLSAMPSLGAVAVAWCESPIVGAKSGRRGAGNREFLACLRRIESGDPPPPPD